MKDKIIENQYATSKVLVPFTQELQRRNDLLETAQSLPFYNAGLEAPFGPLAPQAALQLPFQHSSTPGKSVMYVDPDQDLNTTDRENLDLLNLSLPSEVQKQESYDDTLQEIKTKNREIGQYLGKGSKKSEGEKAVYVSQKQTLQKYGEIIKNLQGAVQFITKKGSGLRKLCKIKRNRGRPKKHPDVIICNSADELVQKLQEYVVAKEAGNTGLDNYIISMLDELLNIKAIDKNSYDTLYKNIF